MSRSNGRWIVLAALLSIFVITAIGARAQSSPACASIFFKAALNAGDDFERLQQRLNRELAIRNLDRDSKLLKDVEEALSRIETGVFGMCLQCEDKIPEKRLNAVPWASYCLTCQEEFDRCRDAGELEGDDDKFSSAA